jgi:hypothetical protein
MAEQCSLGPPSVRTVRKVGVTWGANPAVIEGKDGVLASYNSVGEAVLWHSDDRLAVGDWGVADEITYHQLARGADLRAIGYDVEDSDELYHVSSRQAFIWPDDECAPLAGEHLYEDKTSLQIEAVDPSEAITPQRVPEIHREQLAKLEAERAQLLVIRPVLSAINEGFHDCEPTRDRGSPDAPHAADLGAQLRRKTPNCGPAGPT